LYSSRDILFDVWYPGIDDKVSKYVVCDIRNVIIPIIAKIMYAVDDTLISELFMFII
jgi:hypothetical protein